MSERDWLFRLEDIAERCQRIIHYTKGIERRAFINSPLVIDAVLRNLEIIGEAAARIDPEHRARHPNVPWSSMIGMRNRLIHDYPSVDLAIVWQTICEDIPALLPEVEAALTGERTDRDRPQSS